MKHLKPFNESKDTLQDFCDNCLIYLYDEGMGINIYELDWHKIAAGKPSYIIWLDKQVINSNSKREQETFYWDDIKDYYIPFLKLLDKNYNILGFNKGQSIRIAEDRNRERCQDINLDDLINDSIDRNIALRSIGVVVKK
jgi:hypothetical protein